MSVEGDIGEQEIEGGFRRVSPEPEPNTLVRLRGVLQEAPSGRALLLRQGLDSVQALQSVATLCRTEWSAGILRGGAASQRLLRRLQGLGVPAITVARAAELPLGTPVHLRGAIRPVLPSRLNAHISHIWSRSAMTTDNVRVTVEEGHDFFLAEDPPSAGGRGIPAGDSTVRVIAARGYLLNVDTLVAGDHVSIYGFTDRAPAPSGIGSRAETELVVRAGDDAPLLVRRIPTPPANGNPTPRENQ